MRFCCSVKPSQLWWDCSPIRTINEIFRTIPLAFRRARGLPLPLHRTSPPSQPLQKNDNPSPRTKLASLVKGRWLDGKAQALTLCIYLRYAHHFYIANFSAAKTEGLSRRHLLAPAPKIAPHSMSGRKCGGAGVSNRACSVGFASCETWGKHYRASLHVYERSVGFASCETLGVHFIRHPCLTRTVRVRPPAPKKV